MRFEAQVRHLGGAAGPLPALEGSLRLPVIALALSIVVHAALLFLLGGAPHDIVPAPVIVVTFSAETPVAPPVPVPEATVESAATQHLPAPLVAKEGPPIKTNAQEPAPSPPVPQHASTPPEPDDPVPRARMRPGIAPEIARELSNRHLRVSIWVDPSGNVSKVDFGGNELTEGAILQLTDSLQKVRFAPARRDGNAVEAVLRTRMCFDEDGALEGNEPECSVLAAPSH
ncbi:MAG TPA: hypothetical protein VIE63_05550 [Ramlibacter sp.]|jgi:hypothetical protein